MTDKNEIQLFENQVKNEGNETYDKIVQLKMTAAKIKK